MIRTLDRLVIGTFLKLFLTFVLSAPVLFILADLTEKLEDYLDFGVTWAEGAQAYLLQYPHFMFWAFPVAAMVAVVFTIHGMTSHREIMAAKAGGVSFRRLVYPLLALSLVLCAVDYGLSEAAPRLNRRAADLLRGGGTPLDGDSRSRFVYKGADGRTLSADLLTVSSGFMDNPRYELELGDGGLGDVVADRATWEGETWTFHRGVSRAFGSGQAEFSFDELVLRDLDVAPSELQQRKLDDLEMTREELATAARNLQGARGAGASGAADSNTARNYLVERELRWAIAAASFVIILFGAPLATSSKRGGAAFGVGVSMGSTIVYMLLLRLAKAVGTIGLMSPVWAAWTPNIIFFVVGAVLLMRVRT